MLNPVEIIIKKRAGDLLTPAELEFFITGYINGTLPDYQMSALLMAIFLKGMNDEETRALTEIYIASGKTLDFPYNTVDKHSTGGIGDKISLTLAPIVAECGGYIPMMAGRGLGHTGGTLDKLESIPGFKTGLTEEEFRTIIDKIGFSIISQSKDLVPADKSIYALRDVSGTVESLPLITASIMSKKIAEGAKNLVIDLKIGSGAFINDIDTGQELGRLLQTTGEMLGQKVKIAYTNMNSPIGRYIGNALEVFEAIEYLKGAKIEDIDILTKHLAVEMLLLTKCCDTTEQAMRKVTTAIESGKALERFARFIKMQGGDERVCDDSSLLPQAAYTIPIKALTEGWTESIDCRRIGYALLHINSGRKQLNSKLDHSTGAYLETKVGDYIRENDVIGKVLCNDEENGKLTARLIASAIKATDQKIDAENILLNRSV